MHMQNLKLDGTLLGAAGAALWWWSQDNQDRDDRLRNVQLDNRALSNRLNALMNSADWIRIMSPAMRDAGVGIAAATPTTAPAQTVPPITPAATRPDLSAGSNINHMQWPPTVGQYDAAGRTSQPGELSLATYVQTYQEPRAWNQGLTQSQAPTGEQLQQLFWSAQGLSRAALKMKRSPTDWETHWWALLGGGSAPASAGGVEAPRSVDPHQDVAKAPSAVTVGAAKIFALNDPASGAPPAFTNTPQTDSANRWRIQCSAAGHAANEKLARVSFRTEYILRTPSGPKSIQPIVMTHRPQQVYADNVTSAGFDLVAGMPLGGSAYVDVYVMVNPGVAAELLLG
jgi:hypothetical protein